MDYLDIPNCSLFAGDNVEVMRREIPDNSVQLTVTSPPYDNLRTYNGFTWDFAACASELYRVTKPGGVVVWVVADATINGSETGTSLRQALFFRDVCGFNLHDTMIFSAAKPPLNSNRYQPEFEYMFVLSKGKPSTFNPLLEPCKNAGKPRRKCAYYNVDGTKHSGSTAITKETKPRTNIWRYRVGCQAHEEPVDHPARFPENLASDHILSWSDTGDLVLDPFLGSGTTGKMALLNSRRFIGCDISSDYVDLAAGRIKKALTDATEGNISLACGHVRPASPPATDGPLSLEHMRTETGRRMFPGSRNNEETSHKPWTAVAP